jgi:hypothetical protein
VSDVYRYQVEWMENGLIRVFDLASKLSSCYNADSTYRHGDLYAATIAELIGDDQPSRITRELSCDDLD